MATEPERPRIVIAGGSGFVGISLAKYLAAQGMTVSILSRRPPRVTGPWRHFVWDGRTVGDWATELDGATALVNLAGRSVNCRKTPDHQDEILRSRVEATSVLGTALRQVSSPPPVWVQMSTAHIYGDPPECICSEDSALGYGFAPFVGRAWEATLVDSCLPCQRTVVLRTSFVLGRDHGVGGGPLTMLKWLVRFGLGGTVGSGQQGLSWIHETDLHRLIERAICDPSMSGIYIASAPNPVSQREFMRSLRRSLRMPIGLPATAWMVRVAARFLLRTDPELALFGRYVVSQRLISEGFTFHYPQLTDALSGLMRANPV